jgi:uncharacterized protein with NRDE domain
MCTLALAWRVDRRWPVLVAANRDERLGRAAEGWALRDGPGGHRLAAPRDVVAGGTWIGVSARGTFAGLTNFHSGLPGYPDPRRRSRGELVGLALAAPSAGAARAALAAVKPEAWNPFHLVVADGESAFRLVYDGERSGLDDLAPGLHVVTERSPDGSCPRGLRLRARWPVEPTVPLLRELLAFHGDPADAASCIHHDPQYGTRSAAVLRLGADLATSELYVADARPCTAPLEDWSDLLGALGRTP